MPAAAWAARSGDAVLPVRKDAIPAPMLTRSASTRTQRVRARQRAGDLGASRSAARGRAAQGGKNDAERNRRARRAVERIEGADPGENAIAFARYEKGDFGWGVVVPGYNFTLANVSRPLDAPRQRPLATRGVFAPLLLTDDAARLPKPLEDYLLSVQPGYEDDPGEAVYNRAWILGDEEAISVEEQAQLDAITELIPVQANAP